MGSCGVTLASTEVHLYVLGFLLFLAAPAQPTAAASPAATPLHVSSETAPTKAFGEDGYAAWVNPVRCDQDGNLYFLTVTPRDLNLAPGAPPTRSYTPREITRVSPDGKKVTRADPASTPVFAAAQEIRTVGTAVDTGGVLFALLWVPGPDNDRRQDGRQYIVSFDKSGTYASRVEIDWRETILVQRFDVFASGEFLVQGLRDGAPRLAVLSGREIHEVPGLPATFDHMERGGDGRIYVARNGASSVYAIDSAGRSEVAFSLPPPSDHQRLAGLQASGRFLSVVYNDDRNPQRLRSWMSVYDVDQGQQVALYGPTDGAPLCYERVDSTDRFTFLREGNRLATLSP